MVNLQILFLSSILILLPTFSNSIPHFIFDGIDTSRECFEDKDHISFNIYGYLTEMVDLSKIKIEDYPLEHMGPFKCLLSENENKSDEKRTHKISCSIIGSFPRYGFIIEEPKVYGFDFNNEKGESSWPKIAEKKAILIGECGSKIELDNEPLLLSSETTSYTNPLNKVRKVIVNSALASLPKRETLSQLKMNLAMKSAKNKHSLNEAESAYFVYKWLAENIAYDCYGLNHGEEDHGENYTYQKGKGVCSGFSYLFKTFCRQLGLDVEYIVGYTEPNISSSNHAWNVVKIDGSYYLVDATWGSGGCDGDKFVKKFNEYYFCPRPEAFIREHFPSDNKWQLLLNIIAYERFGNLANLFKDFFNNGFLSISPDYKIIEMNGKTTINLSYDEIKNDLAIICDLSYYENDKWNEIKGSVLSYKEKNNIKIDIYGNYEAIYKLNIYGGPADSKSYPIMAQIFFENLKALDKPIYLPDELYLGYNTNLIEPLNGKLTKGTLVDFKIKTNAYDYIAIIIGDSFKKLFEKLDDGIFYGESIYIFDKEILIIGISNNNLYYLFKYDTINNPNILEEPSFPENSINSPANVLYSPLMDTLKKGNTYTFKIKCKWANVMAVYDNSNNQVLSILNKNGDTFSGEVKIIDTANEILIVGLPSQTEDLHIFYSYKTK